MAFEFPADKLDFTASNGITYTYRDDAWQVKSFGVDNSDEIAEILAELQQEVDALPVTIADDPPADPERGDLWFCSKSDDLSLYIYLTEWTVASPPISTDEIESIATNAEARAEEANQKASFVQFQLDQQAEIFRWDQERQDGLILTLEEELEQLVPSLERGVWNYEPNSDWTPGGNYILVEKFLDESDQEQLCTDQLQACSDACDPSDVPCVTACSREFDRCRSAIQGGKWLLTNDWTKAESIGVAFDDVRGTTHTFDNVVPGMIIDVFNVNDEGFMFGEITEFNKGIDGVTIKFKLLRSFGQANGPATLKFFELEDGINGDDLTNFVRKTGDTMEGTLKIEGEKNNLHIAQIPIMGNVKAVPLVVAKDKDVGGSLLRIQQGEKQADGTWYTRDVLKVNSAGQLQCENNRIIDVADPEKATDAINLRSFEDRGGELFVHKDGDTIEGDLEIQGRVDIKAPQNANNPDNSFYIRAPMWNAADKKYEYGALLKDYRPSNKQTNGQGSSVFYYGDIKEPQHIVNKDYIDSKKSHDKAPWTHGPGSMFFKHFIENGPAPVKNKDKWTHGVAHYYNSIWSFHSYSLNDWTSIIYDNKTYSPPTTQPYIIWIWLESTGIWAKAEMGMWKTTKWNDNYCIEMHIDKRTSFRAIKADEIICTSFAGFW